MKQLTITVNKPIKNTLPPVLNEMFDRSLAISEATRKFWNIGLAKSGTLGDVRELEDHWEIDIMYH